MTGVIQGGWTYVWAAYAITTVVLLMYGVSLIRKVRDAWTRAAEEQH